MGTLAIPPSNTTPSVCRVALVITGFLGLVFGSIALDNAIWIRTGSCESWKCPPPWLAQVGLSIVALAWLFSVAMLIGSIILKISSSYSFKRMDCVGNTIVGIGLIAAFGLFTSFVVRTFLFSPCDDNEVTYSEDDAHIYCQNIDLFRLSIFQPVLFSIAGVLALGCGILSFCLAWKARHSSHEPLAGMEMSRPDWRAPHYP